MRLLLALLALAGAACSDAPKNNSSNPGAGGPCAPLEGAYRVAHVTRSGGCGDIPEDLVNSRSNVRDDVSACSNWLDVDPTGCSLSYDIRCPIAEGAWRTEGKLTLSSDGSAASGFEQVSFARAANAPITVTSCSSSYDVTWTRL